MCIAFFFLVLADCASSHSQLPLRCPRTQQFTNHTTRARASRTRSVARGRPGAGTAPARPPRARAAQPLLNPHWDPSRKHTRTKVLSTWGSAVARSMFSHPSLRTMLGATPWAPARLRHVRPSRWASGDLGNRLGSGCRARIKRGRRRRVPGENKTVRCGRAGLGAAECMYPTRSWASQAPLRDPTTADVRGRTRARNALIRFSNPTTLETVRHCPPISHRATRRRARELEPRAKLVSRAVVASETALSAPLQPSLRVVHASRLWPVGYGSLRRRKRRHQRRADKERRRAGARRSKVRWPHAPSGARGS